MDLALLQILQKNTNLQLASSLTYQIIEKNRMKGKGWKKAERASAQFDIRCKKSK